jgi:hypothetical protein
MCKTKRLGSSRAGNCEWIAILVINGELNDLPCVCLLPIDFKKSGNREGAGTRANLIPPSSQQKEEPFSYLSAVGEKNLRPHLRLRRLPPVLWQCANRDSFVGSGR